MARILVLVGLMLLGWTWVPAAVEAQASVTPEQVANFGPFEVYRQQAQTQCQPYLQSSNPQGYLACLQQVAFYLCQARDLTTSIWCNTAVTTPTPAPGPSVLTARGYRVTRIGGWSRERDPRTGQILQERPMSRRVVFVLQRQPNGLYLATDYDENGEASRSYWVNQRCEITDGQGRALMDGRLCVFFPNKPYLVVLLPPVMPGYPPSPSVYPAPGRLQDDFDGDGLVEVGYLRTGGQSGGQGQYGTPWSSGYAEAIGYDSETGALKYFYRFFANERQGLNFLLESLWLFRVETL